MVQDTPSVLTQLGHVFTWGDDFHGNLGVGNYWANYNKVYFPKENTDKFSLKRMIELYP